MPKNIQFENLLSDDSSMVYIIAYKKAGYTYKGAIVAQNYSEAVCKLHEAEGDETAVLGYEKITRSEYRSEKL